MKHSQKTKDKIRKKLIGNKNAEGVIPSKETREKISEARKKNNPGGFKAGNENPGHNKSKEWRLNISKGKIGKMCGSKNPAWKGDSVKLDISIRKSFKYRQWRSDVFTRDDHTCQECYSNKSGTLNAHHIESLAVIIFENKIKTLEEAYKCERLWNLNNGKTLCIDCHKKTDNFGNQKFEK